MFNLEKEIKKWRNSLRKNQALEDGYVEELESHLRDLVNEEITKGKSEEEAFNISVKRIGDAENISGEYYKSDTTSITSRPPWQTPSWMPDLLWNYLKIGIRNIKRYKGYSSINIIGLSVGLACVILISMIILHEVSFDNFHVNKERVYRVYTQVNRPSGTVQIAPVMFPFAPVAEERIPEIKKALRISQSTQLLTYGEKQFYESIFYADESLFKVFTIELKKGNPSTVLSEPNSLVISEKLAAKFFEDENPVGKTITIQNTDDYKITGVFSEIPSNSHFQTDLFASASSFNENNFTRFDRWTSFGNDYTYVLLNENSSPNDVEEKMNSILIDFLDDEVKSRYVLHLQPLNEVHFTTSLIYDYAETTPVKYLIVFGTIATLILLVACINFINLTTARSARRNKEVGIRKVIGARKFQLVKQFLSESFIITVISFVVALVLVKFTLPELNTLVRTQIPYSLIFQWDYMFIFVGLLIFCALAAGGYPAFILSSVRPVNAIKNSLSKGRKGYHLRSILIIFQFGLSAFLIIGTYSVYNQINFMASKDLGFKTEEVIVIELSGENLIEKGNSIKNTILNNEGILSAAFSIGTPASRSARTSNIIPQGKTREDEIHMQVLEIDYDFIETLGINVIKGRSFSKEYSGDKEASIIINETAAKKLSYDNPIGKVIQIGGEEKQTIIGVFGDFHYSSLRTEIAPSVFVLEPEGNRFLTVNFSTKNIVETVDQIKEAYKQVVPQYPINYYFMNERIENFYRGEKTVGKLLVTSTLLAILISCIGIFGLVSFIAEQKSKEIGIRKTLGASLANIVVMLCKQFIKLVVLSNIIIWPLAYLFSDWWLNNFPYKTDISYFIFGATLLVTIIITIFTVGYHTIKAALSNPVEALKYE